MLVYILSNVKKEEPNGSSQEVVEYHWRPLIEARHTSPEARLV